MTEPTSSKFLDLMGHFGTPLGEVVDLSDSKKNESRFWAGELGPLLISGGPGDDNATIAKPLRCLQCGERVELRRDKDEIRTATHCAQAGGLRAYEIHLNIPSGAIVFSNDLRGLVVVDDHDRSGYDIRTQRVLAQSAGDVGLALIHVDNSALSVVREGDEFVVMSGGTGEAEGYIKTDRDWYSAMDRRLFDDRLAVADGADIDGIDFFILAVPPGVYAFSDELATSDRDPVVFSRIRKVDLEPPVLKVETADTATTLAESRFAKLFENREASELFRAFTDSSVDLRWVNGCLRRLSGEHSVRPFGSLEGRVGDNIDARIPTLPVHRKDWRSPLLDWDFPAAMGDIPADANIYYVAGGMMVLKTALSNPAEFHRAVGNLPKEEADEKLRVTLVALLDLACEVAASRGLWDGGSLEAAFAEVTDWFAGEGADKPRPPRLLAYC